MEKYSCPYFNLVKKVRIIEVLLFSFGLVLIRFLHLDVIFFG